VSSPPSLPLPLSLSEGALESLLLSLESLRLSLESLGASLVSLESLDSP
jgi:hypothetical protein